MATGKRGKTVRLETPDEDDEEPGSVEPEGAADDLDALLEEIAGEAEYVVLWRTDGTNGRQEHVDKVPLSRFNAEYVRERHGGGDYIMRAYTAKGAGGRRSVKKYREFSIDRAVPPKSGSAALAWKTANPGAMSATVATEPEKSALPGWLTKSLEVGLPVVFTAVAAYISREKTADPLLVELIRANGNNKGSDGGVNFIDMQRLLADERERALSLGEKIGRGGRRERSGDDGGGGDGTAGLLTEGVRAISTLAEGWRAKAVAEADAMQRTAGAGGAAPEEPLSEEAPHHIPSEPETQLMPAVDRPWIATVRPFAGPLTMMAGRIAPATAAAMISDVLEDEPFEDLIRDIADETPPGFLGRIRAAFPPLQRVPDQWLMELVASILEQVEQPAAAGAEAGAEGKEPAKE